MKVSKMVTFYLNSKLLQKLTTDYIQGSRPGASDVHGVILSALLFSIISRAILTFLLFL